MTLPMDPATATVFAEINTKLDVLISQHATVAGQVVDHEARMRKLEADQVHTSGRVEDLTKRDEDQEARLRSADRWRYAMPISAVGALVAGGAAVIAAIGQ